MIDRSYLPFKSAKEYIDRGMSKWMGFFISEHTSALRKQGDSITFSKSANMEDLLIILGGLYINSIHIILFAKGEEYQGTIADISNGIVYFKTPTKIFNFKISELESITLPEDIDE